MREKMDLVDMHPNLTNRSVNEGFSGGEKKKNEIFQMALLEPKLAILDETDSGLDIDALKTVANGVNALRSPERSAIVVTHYQRLLDYIVPDFVHILYKGKIVKTAGKELALVITSYSIHYTKLYDCICRSDGNCRFNQGWKQLYFWRSGWLGWPYSCWQ